MAGRPTPTGSLGPAELAADRSHARQFCVAELSGVVSIPTASARIAALSTNSIRFMVDLHCSLRFDLSLGGGPTLRCYKPAGAAAWFMRTIRAVTKAPITPPPVHGRLSGSDWCR